MGWIILILVVLFRRADGAPTTAAQQMQINQAQTTQIMTLQR
jgi:hypothetical protein